MSYLFNLKINLIGLSLVLFASNVFGADVATVYFVPFEIETYVPITQATIISQAWEKWTISSQSQTSSLIALLNHGDEWKFDESRVRGLVVSENQTFFVDANGVASANGKLGIKIDKSLFLLKTKKKSGIMCCTNKIVYMKRLVFLFCSF